MKETPFLIWKWLGKSNQLDEILHDRQKNNFNEIRLVSALLVVLSHCYGTGDPISRISGGILNCSYFGLSAFFFLSGLLVSQSLEQSRSSIDFIRKRILRIYPAACVAILFSAFLIGPLVTSCKWNAYFSNPLFFQYLRSCFLVQVYFFLPGVFEHSTLGASVNLPLWSLALEVKLYLFVWIVGYIKSKILYISLIFSILFFGIGCYLFFASRLEQMLKSFLGTAFVIYPYSQLSMYFLIGILSYQYRKLIQIGNYWIPGIFSVGLISAYFHLLGLAAFLLFPSLVLYLAVRHTKRIKKSVSRPDFSYGIYIFAWPIQQLVINHLHPKTAEAVFLFTIVLTFPLALGSWYFIEKKALQWKNGITQKKAAIGSLTNYL